MTKGRFGIHGGQYIPETLMNAVLELEKAYPPGNRSNILWGDAHVAPKNFYELYQQPHGGDRCLHATSAGAERGKGAICNALTYGYTARQGVDVSDAIK